VEDPRRFGIVVLKDGLVRKVVEKPEKPESNLALVGMYFIQDPQLLLACIGEMIEKDMKSRGEYQLTDAFQMMIHRGHDMTTFDVDQWYDCGKPDALLETNRHLLNLGGRVHVVEGSIILPPVFIEDSAVIESSIIGPHVSIAAGAQVRHCIVRDSIVGEGASLSNTMLDRSLIGDKAVVNGSSRKLTIGDMSEIEAL
jgi:glucose-1-phosphate thymidylyltransferase